MSGFIGDLEDIIAFFLVLTMPRYFLLFTLLNVGKNINIFPALFEITRDTEYANCFMI